MSNPDSTTTTIQEALAAELKDALRAGDQNRKDVIRSIETEVARAKAEPGFTGEVDDTLYEQIIASYVKKMDKAQTEYKELGERGAAMAAKLGFETEYLSQWLPTRLDEAATQALVDAAIAELDVDDPKRAGQVVGHLMKSRAGELDGALVNRLVREALEE